LSDALNLIWNFDKNPKSLIQKLKFWPRVNKEENKSDKIGKLENLLYFSFYVSELEILKE